MIRLLLRPLWALLMLPCLITLALAAEADKDAYGEQKVVYHVNFAGGEQNGHYKSTLSNIQNHLDAVGKDKLKLQVVMNGEGLNLLQEAKSNPELGQRISNLKEQGVQFKVCNNTLTSRSMKLDDLYDAGEQDVIPSGVAEVAKLQQEGFSYLKTY